MLSSNESESGLKYIFIYAANSLIFSSICEVRRALRSKLKRGKGNAQAYNYTVPHKKTHQRTFKKSSIKLSQL